MALLALAFWAFRRSWCFPLTWKFLTYLNIWVFEKLMNLLSSVSCHLNLGIFLLGYYWIVFVRFEFPEPSCFAEQFWTSEKSDLNTWILFLLSFISPWIIFLAILALSHQLSTWVLVWIIINQIVFERLHTIKKLFDCFLLLSDFSHLCGGVSLIWSFVKSFFHSCYC